METQPIVGCSQWRMEWLNDCDLRGKEGEREREMLWTLTLYVCEGFLKWHMLIH